MKCTSILHQQTFICLRNGTIQHKTSGESWAQNEIDLAFKQIFSFQFPDKQWGMNVSAHCINSGSFTDQLTHYSKQTKISIGINYAEARFGQMDENTLCCLWHGCPPQAMRPPLHRRQQNLLKTESKRAWTFLRCTRVPYDNYNSAIAPY